jgi:hypothetical protein
MVIEIKEGSGFRVQGFTAHGSRRTAQGLSNSEVGINQFRILDLIKMQAT